MKKYLSVFIAVVIFLFVFLTACTSASPTKNTHETTAVKTTAKINTGEAMIVLSPDKTEAAPGDTINITLTLESKSKKGLGAFTFGILYDEAVLSLETVKENENEEANLDFEYEKKNGSIPIIGLVKNARIEMPSPLYAATFTFVVKENAKTGKTAVETSFEDFNGLSGVICDINANEYDPVFVNAEINVK